MSKATKKAASGVVWFEIPADNPERAKTFYSKMFGWKINEFPGASDRVEKYWHVDTGGPDAAPDGGLLARKHPGQQITNYISVASLKTAMAKVEKLGGKVCVGKTAVPTMGYFAICQDTEENSFALWEMNPKAK